MILLFHLHPLCSVDFIPDLMSIVIVFFYCHATPPIRNGCCICTNYSNRRFVVNYSSFYMNQASHNKHMDLTDRKDWLSYS